MNFTNVDGVYGADEVDENLKFDNYLIDDNYLTLFDNERRVLRFRLDKKMSGALITRKCVPLPLRFLSENCHAGVFLGYEEVTNEPWYIHTIGIPRLELVCHEQFAQNRQLIVHKFSPDPRRSIERAMKIVKSSNYFNLLNFNCHHVANIITDGKYEMAPSLKKELAEKGVFFGLLLCLLL